MEPLHPMSVLEPDLQCRCLAMLALDLLDHPGEVFWLILGFRVLDLVLGDQCAD